VLLVILCSNINFANEEKKVMALWDTIDAFKTSLKVSSTLFVSVLLHVCLSSMHSSTAACSTDRQPDCSCVSYLIAISCLCKA
jgi:hypothetical protein